VLVVIVLSVLAKLELRLLSYLVCSPWLLSLSDIDRCKNNLGTHSAGSWAESGKLSLEVSTNLEEQPNETRAEFAEKRPVLICYVSRCCSAVESCPIQEIDSDLN